MQKIGKVIISMELLLAILLPAFVVVVLFTLLWRKPSGELLKAEFPEF